MTEDQKAHAAKLGDLAERLLIAKYAKGAAEHGGNIWDMTVLQLVDETINEAVDQLNFLLTLKEKLEQ